MKQTFIFKFTAVMKALKKPALFAVLAIMVGFSACNSDDVGDSYYTFTGETVGGYIRSNPERFSEFQRILDTTKVMGLLNAYGLYTCFLPTNEAMQAFYQSRGKVALEDFSTDSLRIIAYNHIIKDFEVMTDDFREGFLTNPSMNGRNVEISFELQDQVVSYVVNKSARILEANVDLHNGVVHTIDAVISPTDKTIVEAIADEEDFSLFYAALVETELYQLLLPIKDENYEVPYDLIAQYDGETNGIGSIMRVPRERKYGFTALMPSDATLSEYGITDLETMKAYAKTIYDIKYPADAGIEDVTHRNNSLNRFIAYHLLDRKIPVEFFIEAYDNTGAASGTSHSVKSYEMYEYIETMAPLTLLEVRTLRASNEYNVFNMTDNGGGVRLVMGNTDNDALNGVYHEIDGILAYSTDVERMLTSKRIRMDAASFFPELRNNDMRVGKKYRGSNPEYPSERFHFPHGYIERVTTSETTNFGYFNADDRFLDYQGDEVFLDGLYDFSIITPPIPAGTYEVRFGYQPTGNRGAAQLYWNGEPAGIPLDLRLSANHAKIGYEQPGLNPADLQGFENDKMMRNRGYMKAPASFKVINEAWYSGSNARMSHQALRRILGIYTFEEDAHHTFSVRAARKGEFMFDYLEFVPIEVIEFEGIE